MLYGIIQKRYGIIQKCYGNVQKAYGKLQNLYGIVQKSYGNVQKAYGIVQKSYGNVQKAYGIVQKKVQKYPTFRTDKARYYRAFQRLLGHTFMLLCLSLGLGVVLAPKLHKYGNKKEGKKNEENNSYHRGVQPAFERAS